MNIELRQLKLTNFKGIKALGVDFEHITSVCGENATGKTTLFDALTFLLWGKDSTDAKDFSIKTLDSQGNVIHKLDHEVQGILEVDGVPITLKRVYREKWARRRGAEESEMTGHETLFFCNDVPLQANEYKTKIDDIVNEGLFKLLTSPLYFNSLKWPDRRRALVKIAGDIPDKDIIATMKPERVSDITTILNSGKPLEEYRKEVAMRKRKLNDELSAIPARIDEVRRATPEPQDFVLIQKQIDEKNLSIQDIEQTINQKVDAYQTEGEKIQNKQSEVFDFKKYLQQMIFDADTKWNAEQGNRNLELNKAKQTIHINEQLSIEHGKMRERALQDIAALTTSIATLRERWTVINSEAFSYDTGSFTCPTCKQELPPDDIADQQATLEKNFNESKARRLADISSEGKVLADRLKSAEQLKETSTKAIEELEAEKAAIVLPDEQPAVEKPDTKESPEYKEIQSRISALELSILEVPRLDLEGLKQQKTDLQNEINRLREQLSAKAVIARNDARVKELLEEERKLAQQISSLEKQEFAIEEYTVTKMATVESRVNSMFKLVKFKMFNVLINSSVEEACECTLNGIPYNDINSAGRIQAGLDIINTLSEFYGVWAPVVVDNAESINELPEIKSQLIRLVVTKDKELIINKIK